MDGPAVTVFDGATAWYKDGVLHRMDGPAAEGSDGTCAWYVDGVEYSQQQFINKFTPTAPVVSQMLKLRKKMVGVGSSGKLKKK
ncbi:hypothetical protein ACFFKC_11805 [Pseudoduganella danionis]|uniref:Uncharacterized protein n=1 Tax=Pseudoduganella danionis TaxID=1890295 RepID=A0ABW9SKV9_9BURK|nr:hypothetical protein [Pseudoduganella danionis]MTW32300.1 hypothetical protein [Pseudoduganella danionis]